MQSDLPTRLRSIARALESVHPEIVAHHRAAIVVKAAIGELRDLADEWYEPTTDEVYLLILGLEALRDQALTDAQGYGRSRPEAVRQAQDEANRVEALRAKLKAKAGYDPKEVTTP